MKVSYKFSLLVALFAAVGCNEKISPELKNGGVFDPTNTTTAVPPEEYFFSVTNTSAPGLNYNLHKTGNGNSKTPCEIKNTTGFSNEIFSGATSSYDISCYFDAEELSLFHQGINFSVNASRNTCDFIGYTPFSYFESMPGDSSDSLIEVKCMNDTTTQAHIASADTSDTSITLAHNGGSPINCNQWLSSSIGTGARLPFSVAKDEDLCRFNYKVPNKEDLNCDIGVINVTSFQVTYTEGEGTEPDFLKFEKVPRTIKCGGKVGNCAKGPIEFIKKGNTRFTQITEQELNKPLSVEYKLPGLIGQHTSTRRYANFRRDLASKELDFGTSLGLTPLYKGAFGDFTDGKNFSAAVMDFYANNKRFNGTKIIEPATLEAVSVQNNMYKAVPLAADPFMGISRAFESNEINPFYTFYCFDDAFDIKARIRMVVREWDRIFPTGVDDNEYVSDIFKDTNARQDNFTEREIPGDHDSYTTYNDRGDWDDFIPMSRTAGASTTAIWSPASGFFNPANFLNQMDLEDK